MRKLLSAGFAALRKNKVLWLCALSTLLISMLAVLSRGRRLADIPSVLTLEDSFCSLLPMLGLFWAAFCGLYIGSDYDYGLLRNKLIIGHTRTSVYGANLIACLCAAAIILAASAAGCLTGLLLAPVPWQIGWGKLLSSLLLSLLTVFSLCAILVAAEMAIPNRAISAVVSLALALALLLCASNLYNTLCEPECNDGYVFINGVLEQSGSRPNPLYVSGAMRTFLTFLINLLPTGQHILIADNRWDMMSVPLMALGSIGLAALATLSGLLAFSKKNIK